MNELERHRLEINMGDELPLAQRTMFIATNVLNESEYYNYNGYLTYLKNGDNPIVGSDSAQVRLLLSRKYEFYRNKLVQGIIEINYIKLPEIVIDNLNYVLGNSSLKKVSTIVNHNVVQQDESGAYLLSSIGYNPVSKVFVTKEIAPRNSLKSLDNILSSFSVKHNVDKVNLLGILLTKFFHHLFPGCVPVVRIEGNQKGVGKSLLSIIISLIYQGKIGDLLTLSDNEDEMAKHLCAIVNKADSKVVCFDNSKVSKNLKELGGAVIEKLVTSPELQFRILGKNKTISVVNNFLFVITTNGGETSSDLAARSMLIELFREGDTKDIIYEIPDLIKFTKDHLDDIDSELLGMINIWLENGCPLSKNVKHRFSNWATVIGGVLESNGYEGFLSNQKTHETESGLAFEFQKIFQFLPKFTTLKARDIHAICSRENPYFHGYNTVANFSKKVLSPLIGIEFELDGKNFILTSAGISHDKSALFFIKRAGHEYEQEQQEHRNLQLLKTDPVENKSLFDLNNEVTGEQELKCD